MDLNKTKIYVGFAIKSRNIKFGIDSVLKQKFLPLVIMSDSLQESSKNKLQSFALKTNTKLIQLSDKDIEDMLNKSNIKVFAITDKGLADAIKKVI